MSEATMKDRTALVTGGAGFVGSNLVRRLLALGCARVHIVDNLLSAERVNVPDDPRVEFSETSITDMHHGHLLKFKGESWRLKEAAARIVKHRSADQSPFVPSPQGV